MRVSGTGCSCLQKRQKKGHTHTHSHVHTRARKNNYGHTCVNVCPSARLSTIIRPKAACLCLNLTCVLPVLMRVTRPAEARLMET